MRLCVLTGAWYHECVWEEKLTLNYIRAATNDYFHYQLFCQWLSPFILLCINQSGGWFVCSAISRCWQVVVTQCLLLLLLLLLLPAHSDSSLGGWTGCVTQWSWLNQIFNLKSFRTDSFAIVRLRPLCADRCHFTKRAILYNTNSTLSKIPEFDKENSPQWFGN